MTELEDYSDDQLKEELTRRKRSRQSRPQAIPMRRSNITTAKELCEAYLDDLINPIGKRNRESMEWEQDITIATLRLFFGDEVKDWIDAQG